MADSNNAILKLQSLQNEYQNKLLQIEQKMNNQISILESIFIINVLTTPLSIYSFFMI